jgi:hypothetical protein
MSNERILNFLVIIFFGIMIIYLLNTPPTIVIKHHTIDKMTNISYLDLYE